MKKSIMKKAFLICLSLFALLVSSCTSWMKDDDFYSDIENDVKVANAPQIKVYVRYAMTRQGKTEPEGYSTFKVEIPHAISATTELKYGFVRWAAFSTSFLATGDNQSLNKDVYFIDDEDYNQRLLPYEIKSPVVVFENPKSPNTVVTINQKRNDIFLVPLIAQRPEVSLSIPQNGDKDVIRNSATRILFSKPMDPDSFVDKITVTQGTQIVTAQGVEIDGEDITDYFDIEFNANKTMLSLKFKEDKISEGYKTNSYVNIAISRDVKDASGLSMTDDEKIKFQIGNSSDSLAPRITQLTGGNGTDFGRFKGMYAIAGTKANLSGFTKMALDTGSNDAPKTDVDNTFFTSFYANRVSDSVILRVYAEDIAGSGSGQDKNGSEPDVTNIGVTAKLLYTNAGATASSTYTDSFKYVPKSFEQTHFKNSATTYEALINEANSASGSSELAANVGCLVEYEFPDNAPDGLYQIDVTASDFVGNGGNQSSNAISKEYGNGRASIFVVRDKTAPDAASYISNITSNSTDGYYNESTISNLAISLNNSGSIVDQGVKDKLRSAADKLKWMVKTGEDTSWNLTISPSDAAWKPLNQPFTNFAAPSQEGEVKLTYAFMDDVGNVSAVQSISAIKYDNTIPSVNSNNVRWEADEGVEPGLINNQKISNQSLAFDVEETLAGIKTIEIFAAKDGSTQTSQSSITCYKYPFSESDLVLSIYKEDDKEVDLVKGTDYTVDENKIVLRTPIATAWSKKIRNNVYEDKTIKTIKIKNLKIADTIEQGNYNVAIKLADAATNETDEIAAPSLSNDSDKPEIQKVYVPDIKAAQVYGTNTKQYWVNYRKLETSQTKPRLAAVYVTFKENNSGINLFDFGDNSTMKLTNDSQLYLVDNKLDEVSSNLAQKVADKNSLKIENIQNALRSQGVNSITVKITNVELSVSDGAAMSLTISDRAKNQSDAMTTMESKDGGRVVKDIDAIRYNNIPPVLNEIKLVDRAIEEGHQAAMDGFTSEKYINAEIRFNNTDATPVYGFVLSGAAFEADSSAAAVDKTSVKINETNGAEINDFIISDDNKTLTFYNNSEYIMFNSDTKLVIQNIKLSEVEGPKNVSITPIQLSEIKGDSNEKSIYLDTTPPQWIGKGIYAGYDNRIETSKVYPHPYTPAKIDNDNTMPSVLDLDEKFYGVSFGDKEDGMDVLYFYKASSTNSSGTDNKFRINPNCTEKIYTNREDGTTVCWNAVNYPNKYCSYHYHNDSGTYKAFAVDRAGNKSKEITYNIIKDESFASASDSDNVESKIDEYMTVVGPDASAKFFRNANEAGTDYNSSTYDYYYVSNYSGYVYPIYAHNYVLKQLSGNGNYEIHIKLGSGITTSDNLLDGDPNAPHTKAPYAGATGSAYDSPIEYYSITHWYRQWSTPDDGTFISALDNNSYSGFTLPFYPVFPEDYTGTKKSDWHSYKKGEFYSDTDIDSSVDANGDIVIKLPNKACPPLAILLKDGCGNQTFRMIKPASMTDANKAVGWIVDGTVGDFELEFSSGIINPKGENTNSEINFYKPMDPNHPDADPAKFWLQDCTDTCYYETDALVEGTNITDYTLRARLIKWTESTIPDYNNFVDGNLTSDVASPWKGKKASSSDTFDLCFDLPVPNNSTPNPNDPYRLFYIIEDTVGNYRIKQLNYEKNTNQNQQWLYDNTPPSASVKRVENVNHIGDMNYYSSNSKVNYEIVETGSGIKNNGYDSGDMDFTTLAEVRSRDYNIELNLGSKDPYNNKITIYGIKDYAGNGGNGITLKFDGCDQWVKQTTPVLYTSTNYSNTATITNQDGNNNYFNVIDRNLDQTETDSDKKGVVHTINSKRANTTIKVKLSVADSEPLLGWIVKAEKLENPEPFYAKDSEALNLDPGLNITKVENETDTYSFSLGNAATWHEAYSEPVYFYAVNRAGLICPKPVIIQFAENSVPGISGDFTYSDVTSYGSGDTAENFLKTESKISFTPANATHYQLSYKNASGNWISVPQNPEALSIAQDSTSISLGNLTTLNNQELTLKLYNFSGNNCLEEAEISLAGPVGVNNWTFDEESPEFTIKEVQSKGTMKYYDSVQVGSNYYLRADKNTVVVSFNCEDEDGVVYECNNATITLTEKSYSFTAPSSPTQYTFSATDKAGNTTTVGPITLEKDATGPVASSITPKFYKDSLEAAGGYYKVTANGDTKAVTYNSNYVNKLVINTQSIEDVGCGFDKLYYKLDNNENETEWPFGGLTLENYWSNKNISIIAKDKLGNSTTVSYTLTADNTLADGNGSTSPNINSAGGLAGLFKTPFKSPKNVKTNVKTNGKANAKVTSKAKAANSSGKTPAYASAAEAFDSVGETVQTKQSKPKKAARPKVVEANIEARAAKVKVLERKTKESFATGMNASPSAAMATDAGTTAVSNKELYETEQFETKASGVSDLKSVYIIVIIAAFVMLAVVGFVFAVNKKLGKKIVVDKNRQ